MQNIFINLRGEMAKKGVEINQVAHVISKSRNTVRDKMSGKRAFTVPEAKKIKSEFFSYDDNRIPILYRRTSEKRQLERGVHMEHRFVVAADAKPLTIEIISQMFFGMSFANAEKDIKENRGGKHDAMWNDKKAHQV